MGLKRMAKTIMILMGMLFFCAVSELAVTAQSPPDMFGGPEEGESAPNFRLQTVDGKMVELKNYVGKKPVVLVLGSYTCPIFRQRHPAMEDLYSKYRDRVEFLVLYTVEAHPKEDPSPYTGREWVTPDNHMEGILCRQPTSTDERKHLAVKAQEHLGIQIPVAIDNMANSTWRAYGSAPNAAYLIGQDGRVKLRQGWFEPSQFQQELSREVE